MQRLVLSLLLASALGAAAPARAETRVIDRVAAVVNEDIILESEVEQLASTQLAMRREMDDSPESKKQVDELRKKALDSLIESQLMRQQATELKITVTSDEVDRAMEEVKKQNHLEDAQFADALKQQGFTPESYRKSLKKQILELKVVRTAVQSRVQISDDEVKAFYNQNAAKMSGDSEAHLKMILLSVPSDAPAADGERKRRVAQKVLDLARQGKPWAELARAYSDDALTKDDGGDLGWVSKGMLVQELDDVIVQMQPGDIRGPIRTARGWQLLQLVERKAGNVLPFDQVKEQLRRQLQEQQLEKSVQAWLKELKKRAHIDVKL